ncbi:hypothetical protein E4U43_003935 [Claviceps pusilla]|uniref:Uncharacterized protein n=1 Tax=Claviceps pusilla TaxID=123648 RepID=A0A9P7SXC9_9HYPO|nr:hypothetical protein E4U43_003935 [Claviceps pusilla]
MADPKLFCQEGPSAPSARRSKRPHLVEQTAGWRLASGVWPVAVWSCGPLGRVSPPPPVHWPRLYQQAANCQAEVPAVLDPWRSREDTTVTSLLKELALPCPAPAAEDVKSVSCLSPSALAGADKHVEPGSNSNAVIRAKAEGRRGNR